MYLNHLQIHVFHLHVVRIVSAKKSMDNLFVLAYQRIWAVHRAADQSVLSAPNVHKTKLALIRNASILALESVDITLNATLFTTIQYVPVNLVTPEIHSQIAMKYQVWCSFTLTINQFLIVHSSNFYFQSYCRNTSCTSKSMCPISLWTILSV